MFLLALLLPAAAAASPAQPVQFLHSNQCSVCHARIQAGGREVAQHPLWSGSMMANAAVDPYFRAKLASEAALTPAARAVIENKCLSCHAPMQQYPRRASNSLLAEKEVDGLGADGVSCTVCHQIRAEGLGTEKSFSAGFVIGIRREIYGPHPDPFPMPMLHHTGFMPVPAKHVRESALCGTCHTVITPTLDEKGNALGEFLEQAPFLEWLASGYPEAGTSCQSCHVPALEEPGGKPRAEYIAHRPPGGPFPPTAPRLPFGLHGFAGGNYQVPALIAQQFPDRAEPVLRNAPAIRENLESALSLGLDARLAAGSLTIRATVTNLAGHKLPTGFPSRRLWLHLTVRDRNGARVFESGAWDPKTGEIQGGGGQPHRRRIEKPEEAIVYEAEMADPHGAATLSLLRAARLLKDNRILPAGFDSSRGARVAPAGVSGDSDFQPGSDTVEYAVPVTAAGLTIRLEALYQNVKPSHAAGLSGSAFSKAMATRMSPARLAVVERRVPAEK